MGIFTTIREQMETVRIERIKRLDRRSQNRRKVLSVKMAYGKMIYLIRDLRNLALFTGCSGQEFDCVARYVTDSPLLCGSYETEADSIASGIIFDIAESYCTGFAHDISSALWEMIRNDSLTEFAEELSIAAACFRKSF